MKFICSIILVLLLIQSVKGQELYGEYLDHNQGLLSKECYDIICDEKGYLLISTQYGPIKYDGEKCKPICMNLPIEERIIYDFEKSPDGTIYMLNAKFQILKLVGNKAIRIGPKKLPDTYHGLTKLHWTKSGLYIISTQNYLKYSFQSKKVNHFYHNIDPGDYNFKYVYDSGQEFPFIKHRHEHRFMHQKEVSIQFAESGQHFNLNTKTSPVNREDQITVGETTYMIINSVLFRKKGNLISQMNLTGILFIESFYNRIWLSGYDGLFELDLKGDILQHHFKGELVAGVAPLRSGGIAVSFNRKGVFICSNIHNRIYKNIAVSSVLRIPPFNFIGTTFGEIYRYDHHHLSKMARIDSLGYAERVGIPNAIWEINPLGKSLLFTSTQGIYCYDRNFRLVRKVTGPRCFYVGLIIDKNNFYCIERYMLRKITLQDWKSKTYEQHYLESKQIKISDFRCHTRLNDSIILFGTDEGLFHFNVKTDNYTRSPFFGKEYAIRAVKKASSGELVVFSRYHGIYIFKENTLIKKITAPSVSVMNGLIHKNNLIVQGNDGIFIHPLKRRKKNEWIKVFNGETKSVFVLQNNLFISYDKDLIITQLQGYKKEQITVILNSVGLGKTKKPFLPAKIKPGISLSLDFDILKFGIDKRDLYYKLSSKGENTIDQVLEGTQINFDALKSGDYKLEVYPVINGKIHFNILKIYRFTIEKTFWESTLFFIVAGTLLVSLILSVFLFLKLRRKKRTTERAELESKLNEYKLLAVKAQVNPHFLSNGLAAIQALILKGDNDRAAQYLAKFSFLMRKILYYSEAQFISLKQELELVDAYLELELLRFRDRFKILEEIQLSESQLNEFKFPSLLLQPILENAIWHGLKFQENNPELKLSFKINLQQELVVQISDNGPGFNSSNLSEDHLSKGNQLISERINALNEQFQKTVASMEVASSTSGTTVTFVFNSQLYQFKQL